MEYSSQLYVPAALSIKKYPPLLNEQGNMWAPDPVWRQRKLTNKLALKF
jgi:hypothetical protein